MDERGWRSLLGEQQGLASRRQLAAAGLSRRRLERLVAAGDLRRALRSVYRDRPLPGRAGQLLTGGRPDPGFVADVRAVLLSVGDHARASRRTAAVLWGFDMAVEPTAIEIDVVGVARAPTRAGVDVRRSTARSWQLVTPVAGTRALAVTSAVDTVLDCALELPLREAVAIADSALRSRACSSAALRRAVSARRGTPYCGRLRRVLRWCDRRSGSVLESLLRVELAEAGLVPPCTQLEIRDAGGRFVGRVDFGWPAQRLVVEADGRRWHDPHDARDRDRGRSNGLARAGWRVLRFTWADVVYAPTGSSPPCATRSRWSPPSAPPEANRVVARA